MPDHEDFLDHTGRTPREFGSVHIYVEPVLRWPSGDAVATVWLQSAFEPLLTTDTLHVVATSMDREGEVSLQRFPLPDLSGGKVVRWSLPLSLPEMPAELQFRVESQQHPKAQRVRPAWKLFDTIEIPKESDMRSPAVDVEFNLGGSLVYSALSGGLAVAFTVNTQGGTTLSQDVSSKRHTARKLAPGFVAPVKEGAPERIAEPRAEVVWTPGHPLPDAVLTPPPPARKAEEPARPTRGALRTCYACGFEGPLAEYERARSCPRCDAGWF